MLIRIAIAHTAISKIPYECQTEGAAENQAESQASAIGVQSTKKLQVIREAMLPVKMSYL